MLAPALSDSAILENEVLIIAIVKIIIYFLAGIKLADIVRHRKQLYEFFSDIEN
jgi:hypothetical protein